jgi:hypothetical protein
MTRDKKASPNVHKSNNNIDLPLRRAVPPQHLLHGCTENQSESHRVVPQRRETGHRMVASHREEADLSHCHRDLAASLPSSENLDKLPVDELARRGPLTLNSLRGTVTTVGGHPKHRAPTVRLALGRVEAHTTNYDAGFPALDWTCSVTDEWRERRWREPARYAQRYHARRARTFGGIGLTKERRQCLPQAGLE